MSQPPSSNPSSLARITDLVPPARETQTDGLGRDNLLDEPIEKRCDLIEMIGEEEAAGWQPTGQSQVGPAMRYLHYSRTIHQLISDRNRAVGIYLAVASLLWTASVWILNAHPSVPLIVPIGTIQRWCLPATFFILAVLAVFISFLLIRTRVGLIYEVAKMNSLLGLPVGRVQQINWLGIFFIQHSLVALAGGCSGACFAYYLLVHAGMEHSAGTITVAILIGVAITVALKLLYVGTVLYTTSEAKLRGLKG